jgi:hypothetical protein
MLTPAAMAADAVAQVGDAFLGMFAREPVRRTAERSVAGEAVARDRPMAGRRMAGRDPTIRGGVNVGAPAVSPQLPTGRTLSSLSRSMRLL